MSELSHDEAIKALCDCAASVTVLSYQEAIEGYFDLRGLEIPASVRAVNSHDELVALVCQYRDDLRYPPSPDSRERRMAAIDAALSRARGEGA
jgi:hypothetical protein